MEKEEFMKYLDTIFEDPQNINMAQLEKLLFKTLKFFDGIRERIASKDPEEREKAMKEATEMQEKLNLLTERIYSKTGLTKEKAQDILSNPANFKPEDWATMQNLEKELRQFQK